MIYHDVTPEGLPVIRVQTDLCTFTISIYGAHILSWVPAGKEEVFYMSPLSSHAEGAPLRGGVPVCWPWFGKARMPQHGVARTAEWSLVKQEEMEDGTARLVLAFEPSEMNDLSVEMEILVGDYLMQTLTTRTGSEAITYAEALHSYYYVGDIRQVSVTGLENVPFVENAKKDSALSESPLVLRDWMDRVYNPTEGEIRVKDDSLKRTIVINRQGSRSSVVWNPWEEGARGIADLPDDGWKNYLCVETANVGESSITLDPGEIHVMSHSIRLE